VGRHRRSCHRSRVVPPPKRRAQRSYLAADPVRAVATIGSTVSMLPARLAAEPPPQPGTIAAPRAQALWSIPPRSARAPLRTSEPGRPDSNHPRGGCHCVQHSARPPPEPHALKNGRARSADAGPCKPRRRFSLARGWKRALCRSVAGGKRCVSPVAAVRNRLYVSPQSSPIRHGKSSDNCAR
jgi:hypothetical protein